MKRARFTDEQIVRILQEADRAPVAEVVILPFLTEIGSRVHAAIANRCFGVTPPKAMFRRS